MINVQLASRLQGMSGNVIREILKLTQAPDIISFAGGLPSPESFPVAELRDIAADIFSRADTSFLQYGITEGLPALRDFIANWVGDVGIKTDCASVLSLTGSQQGIDLACKALLNPGDVVLVERPTYLAALQNFRLYQARVVDIDCDAEGMLPEALAAAIAQHHPRLVYVVPTFQNPSGICWSLQRREMLVEAARKYDFIILEDDPYGRLRYSGTPVPAIAAVDDLTRTIYLGSFSKVISPGLRVGYAVAPPELLRPMIIGKQAVDVHTSNLSQCIVAEFARRGGFDRHIPAICAQYSTKRNQMLAELQRHLPNGSMWTTPEGGLFIWVTLAAGMSTTRLLEQAVKAKVAFIPGTPFFADGGGDNCMRLNFSNASCDEMSNGIARLGEVLRAAR